MTKETRIYNGKNGISSISGAGNIGQLHVKDQNITSHSIVNSKWIKDLTVQPETIKLLEKNIVTALFDINYSNFIWIWLPKENKK